MSTKAKYVTYILIAITILSFVMAFFVKPRAVDRHIVEPEISVARVPILNAHNLAERVAKSYSLAFVIVKGEFEYGNAAALETLRNWAGKNFQRDPNFLHPTSLERRSESNQSIIDSFSYSILATAHSYLEQAVVGLLQWRINDFLESESYNSFRDDFYSVFGQDPDTATLLARYQTHRAQQAIDPILGALLWLLLGCAGFVVFLRSKTDDQSSRAQRILAYAWIALGLFYIVSAWIQNQVPVLISAIICGAIGCYLLRPVKVRYGENHGLNFEWIKLNRSTLALLYWITVSMLLIRIVSWIKTGNLLNPDPVTLVVCSLTGDFLHDPADIKRNIDRWIGVIWTVFSLWIIPQLFQTEEETEWEEDLSPIQRSIGPVGID